MPMNPSTSVPSPWVEKFCTVLPEMVMQARTLMIRRRHSEEALR
jgi:hypothetical protein